MSANDRDLISYSQEFGTDKWGLHWYAQHYQEHFQAMRFSKLNLLEIGIGGYEDPCSGGASLRMWQHFFPNAMIFGIDKFDKAGLNNERIRCFQGDQGDEEFLAYVIEEMGGVDIVIDDGSHQNSDVIISFESLFPLLNDGGYYIVEDIETSYWDYYGGSSDESSTTMTSIRYFKSLIEHLNWQERISPGYTPTYLDQNLFAMYFYHNMVWLRKKLHGEQSAVVVNNERLTYG